jgi:hypothetical protein
MLDSVHTAQAQPWDCGTVPGRVTATLSGGTLTICGDGAVTEYDAPKDTPWYGYRDSITDVVVEAGVTSIEGYTICDCLNLKSVIIPCRNDKLLVYFDRRSFKGSDNLLFVNIIFKELENKTESKPKDETVPVCLTSVD